MPKTANTVRLGIYITPKLKKQVVDLAADLGLSQSVVFNLCFQAGLQTVKLINNPDWREYFSKLIREGRPIVLPNDFDVEIGDLDKGTLEGVKWKKDLSKTI